MGSDSGALMAHSNINGQAFRELAATLSDFRSEVSNELGKLSKGQEALHERFDDFVRVNGERITKLETSSASQQAVLSEAKGSVRILRWISAGISSVIAWLVFHIWRGH
jgi:hypothetical protein